jgi:hypothetical protein
MPFLSGKIAMDSPRTSPALFWRALFVSNWRLVSVAGELKVLIDRRR